MHKHAFNPPICTGCGEHLPHNQIEVLSRFSYKFRHTFYSMVVDYLHGAPGDGEGVIITPVLVGVTNGEKVEKDGVIDTKEKQK